MLGRSDHPISRKAIQESALKVLYRLHRSSQLSYLVGGAVRDLMLGGTPKDYDVATEARPQQVRRLFRNSRIIGRRFRLVHVYFREGIVEVSTFRRGPDPESQRTAPGELLITDDNVFGTPREDAFRRDFTVNALFYSIADYSVIDYVGGIEDLESGRIRAIGDPHVRFQEDPVRMMRACEYAGRLGFTIEERTQQGVHEQRRAIEMASPARLLEELTQLLRSRHAAATLQWMLELGLLQFVLPDLHEVVVSGAALPYIHTFSALDRLVASGGEPSDAALLGALLLPGVLHELHVREQGGSRRLKAAARRRLAIDHAERFATRFRISRVRSERLAESLLMAQRMSEGGWKMPERIRLSQRAVFDEALVLLELMSSVGWRGSAEVEIWRKLALAKPDKPAAPERRRPVRRRRRRRRRR